MASGDSNPLIYVQFVRDNGEEIGEPVIVNIQAPKEELGAACISMLNEENEIALPDQPYALYIDDTEIVDDLRSALNGAPVEDVTRVRFQFLALFRVRPVTRVIGGIPGHSEAVISLSFSPDSKYLASGSGDTTVRLWDVGSVFAFRVCKGHTDWVLCLSWAPDSTRLASGCKKGVLYIWDPVTASPSRKLTGHKDWITSLAWQPFQRNSECRLLASSSKDCTIRIWDVIVGSCLTSLSGHTMSVTSVRWGGTGYLYSASQDRTVRVWKETGEFMHSLNKHGHWVNGLALSTDDAVLKGPFSGKWHSKAKLGMEEKVAAAKERLNELMKKFGERLVSVSDDKTAIVWHPTGNNHFIKHLTGHQQPINSVWYSPNGKYIATGSFDHSIKLWDAPTGTYISTLRGHVQAVYQICWSPDSRFIVSASADSTVKLWMVETAKLDIDLPGHADEVYAIDWSSNGEYVASAGKDCVVKVWHH